MNQESFGKLTKIAINGYKSINECDLELTTLNVLVGANGAGKSNLLSVLELLQSVLSRALAHYAGKKGTETLFYNGKGVTDCIHTEFHFDNDVYSFDLEWTENNSLIFRSESLVMDDNGKELIGEGGHSESKALNLLRNMSYGIEISKIMLNPGWIIYRFQNTTASSSKKSEQNISNDAAFMSEGQNLASFLYRLKQSFPMDYSKILRSVQRVAPFFDDFVLEPKELNDEQIILKWKQKGCEEVFNAAQLSDGTLRFICLATLLLQPHELQPTTIIIDEPELGLHPYTITIFAELVKKVSTRKQIILATQSVELLDHFQPEDVVVVDRTKNGSEFKRLDSDKLAAWLEDDYSLGELWNKNLFGGRVAR